MYYVDYNLSICKYYQLVILIFLYSCVLSISYVISFKIFFIVAVDHEVPFTLPLGTEGFVYVYAHVFYIHFGFSPPSIVVEEEVSTDYCVLKACIFQLRYNDHEGFY